jgi:hypothetical protein
MSKTNFVVLRVALAAIMIVVSVNAVCSWWIMSRWGATIISLIALFNVGIGLNLWRKMKRIYIEAAALRQRMAQVMQEIDQVMRPRNIDN